MSDNDSRVDIDTRIILVDLDGVLVDIERGFLEARQRLYPDLPFIPLEERTTHDIEVQYEALGAGYGEQMRSIMRSDDFYRNLKPIDGAVEALNQMREAKFKVFICTAAAKNTRCIAAKLEWVSTNLGPEWVERVIAVCDKTLVYGHILIDDNPRVTGLVQPPFFQHVVFDQPFNRAELSGEARLTKWSEWPVVLLPFMPLAL